MHVDLKEFFSSIETNNLDRLKTFIENFNLCEGRILHGGQYQTITLTSLLNRYVKKNFLNDHGKKRLMSTDSFLSFAVKRGYFEVFEELLNLGARINDGSLFFAVSGNHKAMVVALIKAGSNVNLQDTAGNTPIFLAGDIEIAHQLIDNGANVNHLNKNKESPLFNAARFGHAEIIKILIDRGANVNQKSIRGETPIFPAIPRTPIVALMLQKGASLRVECERNKEINFNDTTPLNRAARSQECFEFLLDQGAGIYAITMERPQNTNFTNKVVFRTKPNEVKPNGAITTIGELNLAIKKGIKLNQAAMRIRCDEILLENPNNNEVKKLKSALWNLPPTTLQNCCFNFLNSAKMSKYRLKLLKEETLPAELSIHLNPESNTEAAIENISTTNNIF